jgi:multidrug resistance efflux pump
MKRTTYTTIVVIGLAVLVVVGMVLFWPQAPLDSALTSPAAPPTRLVCYGQVDSRQGPLLLQPARPGRILQVLVKERQIVSKGTPLMRLEDRLVKLREQEAALAVQAAQVQLTRARNGLAQYQAQRAQAEAALEAATVKLRTAQHALPIAEKLFKDGFSNKSNVDLVHDQMDEARALIKVEQNKLAELKAVDPALDVKLAELQLERGQVQLNQARQEKEEHVVNAPVEGMVLRVAAQEGDLVSPTSPRAAIWLAPAGDWIVRAEVSQEFAARVQEGRNVRVEDEAAAGLLAKGTVVEVSDWFLPRRQFNAQPTAVNTGLTLECVIELRERHAPLRFGQRVRVRILADQPAANGPLGSKEQ